MIQVLVAEDSETTRGLLVEILSSSHEIKVIGEAKNGREAVEMAARLHPDVVTMDIRMPLLDGFAATKEIMITSPRPIVIVSARVDNARECETTIHALRAGAVAVIRTPSGPRSPDFPAEAQALIDTVKNMATVRVVRHWRPGAKRASEPSRELEKTGRPKIIAVATSTGGPAALQKLLSDIPENFPLPILIVQHITPGFATGLVSWLNTVCSLRVKVAKHGERLSPQTVYLAPDDHHLGVSPQKLISLSRETPIKGFRPSGSYLFESVGKVFGMEALAVILTGMGEDGVDGLKTIRRAGGRIVAQDEESSVVFGMPKAAIEAGLVEHVLPLKSIAAHILSVV